MVSIIENYAAIEGTIIEVNKHPLRPGYIQVKVALKSSKPLEGFPNLAQADEGTTISVNVKKEDEVAKKMYSQKVFNGVVKKAGGQEYFMR
jgi:hypothetical protein